VTVFFNPGGQSRSGTHHPRDVALTISSSLAANANVSLRPFDGLFREVTARRPDDIGMRRPSQLHISGPIGCVEKPNDPVLSVSTALELFHDNVGWLNVE